jgi:uncharacterized cupin superfamily protein
MAVRGTYKNVVNFRDLPMEEGQYFADYAYKSAEVATALGARGLGFHVEVLPAGKVSCPFHFHHQEEELFLVLEGEMTLRQGKEEDGRIVGEERLPVRAGDFVSFPPGTRIAHQLVNESAADCLFLALSRREPAEICEYPDSDKVLYACANGSARRMFLRSDVKDYWHGEEKPLRAWRSPAGSAAPAADSPYASPHGSPHREGTGTHEP